MPTKTQTKEEVVVTSNVKLIAAIKEQTAAGVTFESKKMATGRVIADESQRLGYDEAQTRLMVVLSWRKARNLAEAASEKEIVDFDLRSRPDISKVMTLAFPTNPKGVEEAQVQNEAIRAGTAKKGLKIIGENNLLEIARGNQTVAKFNKGIKPARKPKGPSKLSPSDQLGNRFVALHKEFVQAELVTMKEAQRLFTEFFAEPKIDATDAEQMATSDAAPAPANGKAAKAAKAK